jgi:hypothetical protein
MHLSTTGDSPMKSFELVNLNPAHPVLPIPSFGSHNKDSWPRSPLCLCLSASPRASLCDSLSPWHGIAPFSWEPSLCLKFSITTFYFKIDFDLKIQDISCVILDMSLSLYFLNCKMGTSAVST